MPISKRAAQRFPPSDTTSVHSRSDRASAERVRVRERVLFSPATAAAGTIYYCLTGSGFGRKEFEANNGTATQACAALGATPVGFGARQDPLDFVGSDVAMASTECCTSGTTYFTGRISRPHRRGANPSNSRSIGGPIVYGYRQQDFKGHDTDHALALDLLRDRQWNDR